MKVCTIEDDPLFNKLIRNILINIPELTIESFENGNDFITQTKSIPDLVTLDLGLPDISGQELFQKIKIQYPETKIIIISGQDDIRTAVKLLKEGASDYITKDESIKERLQNSVRNIIQQKKLNQEILFLKTEISKQYNYQQAFIGESPAVKEISSLVNKAIHIPNMNVSVHGQPGTGKELIAKIIHFNSSRKENPFVSFSPSSIPGGMIDVELFGHEQSKENGNFLSQKGKLEESNNGTIYIEDINDLNTETQQKLLKTLQQGQLTRIGGSSPFPVNIRIVSASRENLAEAVQNQKFREDLYFKLRGLPIHLPPLKERQKDILLLSNYFLKQLNNNNNLTSPLLTIKAQKKLLNYSFPGNVRELKAIIELAAVLSNNNHIDEDDIIFNTSDKVLNIASEELTLKEYNEKIIRHFLDKYKSVMKVAKKLEIGKSTIYNLLKKEKSDSSY